ncbi:hypothetical protein ACQW02_10225 [Humitalea sp. 24SJ18S-53]|uniref:hypothetical protein n=1 Tax=Humitalea sp. 24SJ18S-53 TaxID=3422307 RepID=UPI003D6784A1
MAIAVETPPVPHAQPPDANARGAKSLDPAPDPHSTTHRMLLLVDDVDLLIDHLGRHRPGRLDACFEDSRGDLPRPANVPFPPQLRPGTVPSKAEFLRRWADISTRADVSKAVPPAGWDGQVDDMVFLVAARDFLAALALPATVSMIRLTNAYVRRCAQGALSRAARKAAQAASSVDLRSDEALGYRLATTATVFRWICLFTVILTLLVSLMTFGGKRLLEEQDRWLTFLGTVTSEIATEQSAPMRATTPAPDASTASRIPELAYCDEPFLDAGGAVLYRTARQDVLCNRLWGINRTVNQLNGHLEAWGDTWIATPFMWLTGLSSSGREGRVRVYAEAARPASLRDALVTLGWTPGTPVPEEMRAQALGLAARSQERFDLLKYLSEQHRVAGGTSPTQAKAMIEALSLYVMPCFYALLGAFVAVFQGLKRRAASFTLERSERDQAMATLLYGVVFGALVGILADMLRAPPISGAAGDEVVLGVSVIALLAGYSVAHVFRFLDNFADRIFGAARPEREGALA